MRLIVLLALALATMQAAGQTAAVVSVGSITDVGGDIAWSDCTWQTSGTRTYSLAVNYVVTSTGIATLDAITLDTLRPDEQAAIQVACVDQPTPGATARTYWGSLSTFDTVAAPIPDAPVFVSATATTITVNIAAITGVTNFVAYLDLAYHAETISAGEYTFTGLTACEGYLLGFSAETSAGYEGEASDNIMAVTTCP